MLSNILGFVFLIRYYLEDEFFWERNINGGLECLILPNVSVPSYNKRMGFWNFINFSASLHET